MRLMIKILKKLRGISGRSSRPRKGPGLSDPSSSRSSDQAVEDLVFHPDDLTLQSACEKSTGPGNPEQSIGDLVFNPGDHTFEQLGGGGWNPREKLVHCYVSVKEILIRIQGNLTPPRAIGLATLFILLGIICYLALWDSYRVETRLLFFQRDNLANGSSASVLEREVAMFKNLEMMALFAADVYGQISSVPEAFSGDRTVTGRTSGRPKVAYTNSASASDLRDWLRKSMSVDSEISNGVAKVSLSLQGDEPDLLKAVMDAYISSYAEHRLTLEAQGARPAREEPRDQAGLDGPSLTKAAFEQLQKIELQQHGCELVLKLIDQGKGVFSGFVPDGSMAGTPSLSQFQEKIVQLEIKKRALEVQFTPNAREVRAVDLEIQGVKRAMRECLVEHLEFLKKGKEQVLVQNELSAPKNVPTRGPHPNGDNGSPRHESASSDSWILIRDGLYMLRDTPRIGKKPLLVRAGDFKRSAVAYFSPAERGKLASKADRTKGSSHPPNKESTGNGANLDRTANARFESQSLPGNANAFSRVSSGREDSSRVEGKPDKEEVPYWDPVPASHFGRRPLW
ncbi:MAG: hypothetical protein HY913_24130 [Desulfomonile tiedjei]|nr:hypothetical protein [Desulfomonile tiedjei]